MLQQLRKATKSWFAMIIIGTLVAAFALWGVGDIFLGRINITIATVGDTQVSAIEFDRELRTQIRLFGQQTGNPLTLEDARALGLDRYVLNNIIARAALDETVRELGLTASDAQIAERIRNTPAFVGVNGSFDRFIFQQSLIQSGMTEEDFIAATRADVARGQLLDSVADGVTAPPGLTRLFYEVINEIRTAEYFVLTPDDTDEISEPDEDELAQYHTAQSVRFSAPEYREIEYVVIGPEQVSDQVEVTEEDLRAEFELRREVFEQPERRQIEQIVFTSQEEAADTAARITEGAVFTDIAAERGLTPEDYQLGTLDRSGLAPQLAETAFSTLETGITEPVQGPFGWVLMRVVEIMPATTTTFEEVRDILFAEVTEGRAIGFMADLANAFEDERAGGALLSEAAQALGLTAHHIQAMDSQGLAPDGSAADLPPEPALLEQAFSWEDGEESSLFEGDDGSYYAVRVVSIMLSQLRPLEEVRDQVQAAWIIDRRAAALRIRAQELAGEARETSLALAAQSAGKEIEQSGALRRDAPNEIFAGALLQQLFAVPVESVIVAQAANGMDYAVARVVGVEHPAPDPADPTYAGFATTISQQLSQDMLSTLADAAQGQAGVTINTVNLQTVLGETPLF